MLTDQTISRTPATSRMSHGIERVVGMFPGSWQSGKEYAPGGAWAQ
jgi:hypothetical protein